MAAVQLCRGTRCVDHTRLLLLMGIAVFSTCILNSSVFLHQGTIREAGIPKEKQAANIATATHGGGFLVT